MPRRHKTRRKTHLVHCRVVDIICGVEANDTCNESPCTKCACWQWCNSWVRHIVLGDGFEGWIFGIRVVDLTRELHRSVALSWVAYWHDGKLKYGELILYMRQERPGNLTNSIHIGSRPACCGNNALNTSNIEVWSIVNLSLGSS